MANTLYRKFKKRSLFRPLQGGWQVNPSRGRYGGGLVGSFQQAMDKANAANERRYQQILSGFDDLAKRTQGNLAGLGQAQLTDINREYGNAGSNVYNTLVNRGFGNSSLPATMQQGVMRGRSQEVGRLNEQLARMRADYDMAITQGKLGAIERRSDIAPDYGQLVQLAQAMGRGGYGSPGYGGGYGVGYGGGGSPGGYGGGGGGMFMSPIGPGGDYWQNTWNNAYQNAMYWATFQRPGMFPYTPRANVRSQMSRLARYGGRMPAPVAGPAMAGQAPRIPGAAMKYGKTLARYLPGAMGILPGLPPYGPQAGPQTGSPNMGMQNQIFNMLSSRLPAASSPAYSPLSELQRRRSNWSQAAVPNMDMQNQLLNMLSQRLPGAAPVPAVSPLRTMSAPASAVPITTSPTRGYSRGLRGYKYGYAEYAPQAPGIPTEQLALSPLPYNLPQPKIAAPSMTQTLREQYRAYLNDRLQRGMNAEPYGVWVQRQTPQTPVPRTSLWDQMTKWGRPPKGSKRALYSDYVSKIMKRRGRPMSYTEWLRRNYPNE